MTATTGAPLVRPRTAWIVLGVGVLAYVLTVMQRTTFGVAGIDAAARFEVSPGALSMFVFIQVAVYVTLQIPAGLLVDRWGSRTMIVSSGLLLVAGQLLLAFASDIGTAIPARVLVGAGDAMAFVAVLALIPRWFPAKRVPLLTQLAGITGQLGQVLSAIPFAALLHSAGWSVAFTTAAAGSALVIVLVIAVVRNAPGDTWTPAPTMTARAIAGQLRQVWMRPGTRLGFFGHMGTQFSMMAFVLLWGVPYLVSAQGLTTAQAGVLMTVFVVCTIGIGPVIGVLTMRHPMRRSWLLLGIIAANVTIWTVVLSLSGPAPMWLLVILVVVLSADGPGSVVGFDIARTSNPSTNLGVAQSMVNTAGFLATLLVLASMGMILTALGGFTPEAFRVAWLVQYPIWAFAVMAVLITRRKARKIYAARGVVPRPLREAISQVR